MSVMAGVLRRHGATMVERHGRMVAADFGSAAGEVTVCLRGVGLAERSDRATLEVRDGADGVDRALEELTELGDRAWAVRVLPGEAVVRCDGEDEAACAAALARAESARVHDVSSNYAAFDLVGPLAAQALDAAAIDEEQDPVIVVSKGPACVELLVSRSNGPALWNRLLEASAGRWASPASGSTRSSTSRCPSTSSSSGAPSRSRSAAACAPPPARAWRTRRDGLSV